MSNEVRETAFRLMVKARVFHRKEDGVITQLFIDESGVGYVQGDNLTQWEKAFVSKNADALMLAATMCLLEIAKANSEEEKAKAASSASVTATSQRELNLFGLPPESGNDE